MATIISLPHDVIVIILKKLSIKDIENFSSTCKKFRQTAWGNSLWIKKFYQRWPSMKAYDSMYSEDLYQIDFKERVKAAVKYSREMWELVSQMYKDKCGAYKRIIILTFLHANIYSTNYFILLDEVKRIFLQSPWEPGHDLTRRYYSCLIYRLLRLSRTRYKYLKFRNGPKEQQLLERIVTIVVQWFRPDKHISYSKRVALIDKITINVFQALKEQCPTHPILGLANGYYNYWRNNNIDYSYWNYEEILPILKITEKIIFSQAYFHKLNKLWLKSKNYTQNVYYVSAGSQSIFLLTIYHSVMRRLGVCSLLIEDSLQLYVKPKDNTRNVEYFCLKLRHGQFCLDNIIRTDDRSTNERDHLLIIDILIERLEAELTTLFSEELLMLKSMLTGKYINISAAMKSYNNKAIPRKTYTEERSAKMKFVIGTIVNHRCNNETHTGVIVGWNLNYTLPSTIGITFDNFPLVDSFKLCPNSNCTDSTCYMHKPYYITLCEHNIYCYTEQENISKYDQISSKWIDHDDIGRYFCRYEGNYYVPNEMLAKEYPSDVAVINEMRINQ